MFLKPFSSLTLKLNEPLHAFSFKLSLFEVYFLLASDYKKNPNKYNVYTTHFVHIILSTFVLGCMLNCGCVSASIPVDSQPVFIYLSIPTLCFIIIYMIWYFLFICGYLISPTNYTGLLIFIHAFISYLLHGPESV